MINARRIAFMNNFSILRLTPLQGESGKSSGALARSGV
jgi:hypothetical protein